MVHRREINGNELVFGNHGALWGNAMTLWDHDTGSVWGQVVGEAIMGPRKGEQLELLPSTLTTWADWQARHPDTLALATETSFNDFALEHMSLVVELGEVAASFPVQLIRSDAVVNTEVAGVPVAIVVEPDTDNWHIFNRQLSDRTVELAIDGSELVELRGDGAWDVDRGLPRTSGDEVLALVPGFTSFQRDFWTFFPEGLVWDGTRLVPRPDG